MATSFECEYAIIEDIVGGFLIKDSKLLGEWLQFTDRLKSEPKDRHRWQCIYTTEDGCYRVFYEILNCWVARNPATTVNDLSLILRRMDNIYLAEQLEEHFGEESIIRNRQTETVPSESIERRVSTFAYQCVKTGEEVVWPITHGLSITTKNFSGRKPELQQLNSYFNSKNNLILVCGFGGIGKTELCKKFANEINCCKLFGKYSKSKSIPLLSRVWLHGDAFETLHESVLKLASDLGISNQYDPNPSEYFHYLITVILRNSSRLLVVIDNIDIKYEEVTKIIKMVKNYPKIFMIITSRNSMVLDKAGITLKLDILEKKKARQVLQKSIRDLSLIDADKLCELVQYYPLALQQAIAYITQQQSDFETPNYSVSDYVEEFERKKSEMLGHKLNDFEHDYSMTTLVTWDLTIEKMSGTSLEILKVLAHLGPDGIEIEMLKEICKKMNAGNGFRQELKMIYNYSLVKIENGKMISIHRLIQEVIKLGIRNPDYLNVLFDSVLLSLVEFSGNKSLRLRLSDVQWLNTLSKLTFNCEVSNFDRFCSVLEFLLKFNRIDCAIEYTKKVFKNVEFLPDLDLTEKVELLEKVLLWSIVDDLKVAKLSNNSVEIGRYGVLTFDLYLPLLDVGLILAQKYFPWSEEMVFKFKNELAKNLLQQNQRRQPANLTKQCISLCEEVIDSNFESEYDSAYETICIAKNIKLSDNKNQIDVLEKLLSSKRKKLGENHRNTIKIKKMLAQVFEMAGKLEQAVELLEEIRDFFATQSESNDIEFHRLNVIRVRLQFGNIPSNLTRDKIYREFSEVENYQEFPLKDLKKILSWFRNVLGDNDKLTLRLKNEIAWELYRENKCNDSVSLLNEVISSNDIDEIKFAFDTMQIIGAGLNLSKDYEKSKELLERVLKYRVHHVGHNHEETIKTKAYLARTLHDLGESDRALQLNLLK